MSNKLIITVYNDIDKEDKDNLSDISTTLIQRTQLAGGGIITEAIVLALSPFIIKGIKDVLLLLINKQKNVSIKYKDIEIKNIDSNQVIDIISKLQEQSNNNSNENISNS